MTGGSGLQSGQAGAVVRVGGWVGVVVVEGGGGGGGGRAFAHHAVAASRDWLLVIP